MIISNPFTLRLDSLLSVYRWLHQRWFILPVPADAMQPKRTQCLHESQSQTFKAMPPATHTAVRNTDGLLFSMRRLLSKRSEGGRVWHMAWRKNKETTKGGRSIESSTQREEIESELNDVETNFDEGGDLCLPRRLEGFSGSYNHTGPFNERRRALLQLHY